MKIALLPGDGIGPEIVAEAVKVLKGLDEQFEFEEAPIGGQATKRVAVHCPMRHSRSRNRRTR
jgi:3-isopropylmalate dehydrogenase